MSVNRPKLIVITPVRNEAWVLEAFLTCTSSWADHIIIADQHSTDGSREIASNFNKVILVDNDATEMNQAAARLMLFQEVDKIEGDKIIFALDADEFLSENFEKTKGWKRILESKPNEIFCFKWLNLYGDYRHGLPESGYMEWACHFSKGTKIAEEYERCEKNAIHEMRVPCLSTDKAQYVAISDIKFIHLAQLNQIRQKNKNAFYQVHTLASLNKRTSAVSIYRTYNPPHPQITTMIDEIDLIDCASGEDVKSLVRLNDVGHYYIDEMLSIIRHDGLKKFLKLSIWDNPFIKAADIKINMPLHFSILHWYLKKTQKVSDKRVIKSIDKALKYIV